MYAKAYGGNGSVLLPLIAVKNLLQSIATNLKCRTAKSVQCQKVQIDEIVKTKISAQKKNHFLYNPYYPLKIKTPAILCAVYAGFVKFSTTKRVSVYFLILSQ